MATTFTAAQQAAVQAAADYMTKGTAVELPFDAAVIERLAPVAVAVGFATSTGQFLESCKLNPISTLIRFVEFVGGTNAPVLPKV